LSNYRPNYVRGSAPKKGPSPLIPILIIAIGILAAAGFLVYSLFFGQNGIGETTRTQPNMQEISFFDHPDNHHLTPGRLYAVLNGNIITDHAAPTFIDGQLHLPADFLRAFIDRYIFWEPNSNRLTITTFDEVKRFRPNDDIYTINWNTQPLAHPIREIAGMAYMSADMVMQRYPATITHLEEFGFVIIDLHRYERLIYETIEATYEDEVTQEIDEDFFIPMRFGASDQYPIMHRLQLGNSVVRLADVITENEITETDETNNEQTEAFYRVQAENGLIGYVLADNLIRTQLVPAIPHIEHRRPITRTLDGSINLAYHDMGVNNPDSWQAHTGVNVMAPMWFRFDPETRNGDIISWARHDYVDWAHRNGMEVWPAIMDMFLGGNFSNEVAQLVLLDAEIRDHVIAQLMQFIATYNLDGINVDYEQVWAPEADYWIQFLRELAVPMRQAGSILSVAIKVPIPDNMYWNRTEIGLASDFVVIMAYDEHWRTSPIAGPVASYDFVLDGIRNTLNEIPNYQVVVALPTYVNIWREEFVEGEWQLDWNLHREVPRQVGMAFARSIIANAGAELIWDYHIRQYYAEWEFIENGIETRHRVWLEDMRSMREKLALVRQFDLAGVGFWQVYLAYHELWPEVVLHLN